MDRSELNDFLDNHLSWKVVAEFPRGDQQHMVLFFEESIEHVEVRAYTERQLYTKAVKAMQRVMNEYDEGLSDVVIDD